MVLLPQIPDKTSTFHFRSKSGRFELGRCPDTRHSEGPVGVMACLSREYERSSTIPY
jgi:hypothetical protein